MVPPGSWAVPQSVRHRMTRWFALALVASAAACDEGVLEPSPSPQAVALEVSAAPESGPAALAQQASQLQAGDAIPGHWIVVFNRDVPDAPGLARRLAAQHGSAPTFVYQTALKGFAAPLSDQAVAALARNPNVARIEQDQVATSIGTQADPTWGLDRIDQRNLPLDASFTYDNDGSGVHAYVIDTGIRTTHSDFGGRASFDVDFIGDGNEGVNNGDCDGHGTHVAGTVGGSTWGVAKNVSLHAVRVLGCTGSGSYSGVIGGVDWVAANHIAPAVANMSLGGGVSSSLNQAVENAIQAGVVFAVAAGNENKDACNRSPASAASALTVGASTSSDNRSSFSNFGTCVDLFAPGSAITSSTANGDNTTGTWNGTSMASPHVAGAAALVLADNGSLSPGQVSSVLLNNATAAVLSSIGSGSPNLLLYSVLGSSPPPPPPADVMVHVDDISVSMSFGRKNANGTATVMVVDDAGAPVSGALVVGDWLVNGVVNKAGTSATTEAFGGAAINSGGMRRVSSSDLVEFCVTSISGSGLVYDEAANVESCDSDQGAPPPPPGELTVDARSVRGGNKVAVSWTGGEADFVISRTPATGGVSVELGTVSGNTYEDDPPAGSWTYEVCDNTGVCAVSGEVSTRR